MKKKELDQIGYVFVKVIFTSFIMGFSFGLRENWENIFWVGVYGLTVYGIVHTFVHFSTLTSDLKVVTSNTEAERGSADLVKKAIAVRFVLNILTLICSGGFFATLYYKGFGNADDATKFQAVCVVIALFTIPTVVVDWFEEQIKELPGDVPASKNWRKEIITLMVVICVLGSFTYGLRAGDKESKLVTAKDELFCAMVLSQKPSPEAQIERNVREVLNDCHRKSASKK